MFYITNTHTKHKEHADIV
uniref:Uncharacterized protein n=1 Tax=Moniliophthora roreri TaxID=221103 RepID=A0A0W0FZ00_MONRR